MDPGVTAGVFFCPEASLSASTRGGLALLIAERTALTAAAPFPTRMHGASRDRARPQAHITSRLRERPLTLRPPARIWLLSAIIHRRMLKQKLEV